jgi:hypothetical protein
VQNSAVTIADTTGDIAGASSLTAPATTPLTLAGGSTGASLVLGQGTTAADVTLTAKGTGSINLDAGAVTARSVYVNSTSTLGPAFEFRKSGTILGIIGSSAQIIGGATTHLGLFAISSIRFWTNNSGTEVAQFSTGGNLLIGTTTDIAGTGGLHVAGTGTASTTTSGALRVGSNVGLSGNAGGASYFGGQVHATSSVFTSGSLYVPSGNRLFFDYGVSNSYYAYKNGTTLELGAVSAVNVPITTSASSSTVGALTIGNGTAATNVAIGGGNVNAGGTGTFGGGNHVFGNANTTTNLTVSRITTEPSSVVIGAGASQPNITFGSDTAGGYTWGRILSNGSEILRIHNANFAAIANVSGGGLAVGGALHTAGAATFAGAVSLSTAGTTISIKSGTNAAAGTVTLTGGAGTITSTAIDVNTVIVMSIKTKSGSFDHAPSVLVAAGSATIDGHNSDDSTYNWVALKVN